MIPETNGTTIEVRGEVCGEAFTDVVPVIAWDDEGRPLVTGGRSLIAAETGFSDYEWRLIDRIPD